MICSDHDILAARDDCEICRLERLVRLACVMLSECKNTDRHIEVNALLNRASIEEINQEVNHG